MKILVTVKRVVDPYAKVRPLPDGSGIDDMGAKAEINPFDEIALEEAVRMRDRLPDVEVVVVAIGPSPCEEQLRKALAFGADRALLIETNDAMDSLCIAKELAALVNQIAPDLVLMGKQATDDDNCQAAQMLAAVLDWPQAVCASKIEVENGEAVVTRETDTGEETLGLPLPCVITADLRLNEPRYIALPGIIRARTKPLDRLPRSTSARPFTRVTRFESPPPRPAGRKVASVDELVAALRDRGVSL